MMARGVTNLTESDDYLKIDDNNDDKDKNLEDSE